MELLLYISKTIFQGYDYLSHNKIHSNIKGPDRIRIDISEIIYKICFLKQDQNHDSSRLNLVYNMMFLTRDKDL